VGVRNNDTEEINALKGGNGKIAHQDGHIRRVRVKIEKKERLMDTWRGQAWSNQSNEGA
jgi:hypothetical protein